MFHLIYRMRTFSVELHFTILWIQIYDRLKNKYCWWFNVPWEFHRPSGKNFLTKIILQIIYKKWNLLYYEIQNRLKLWCLIPCGILASDFDISDYELFFHTAIFRLNLPMFSPYSADKLSLLKARMLHTLFATHGEEDSTKLYVKKSKEPLNYGESNKILTLYNVLIQNNVGPLNLTYTTLCTLVCTNASYKNIKIYFY